MRALAVVSVVLAHVQNGFAGRLTVGGSVGVAMFFALSGFLITRILLRGADGYEGFYRNRALRLLPALVVFVLVAGAIQQHATGVSMIRLWPSVTYVGNWLGTPGSSMTHLWSLAVEEQFYLVWPVLLALVTRWRNGPLLLCLAGMAGSLALKVALWHGGAGAARLYAGSDTQAWALLCGCLLAVLAQRGLHRPARVPGLGLLAVAGVALAALVGGGPVSNALVVPLVVPLLTAGVIWGAVGSGDRLLRAPLMCLVGRRSYALYLWHPLTLAAGASMAGRNVVGVLVGIVLAAAAAQASWWLVESPFLRLKLRTRVPAIRPGVADTSSAGSRPVQPVPAPLFSGAA